MGQKSKGPHIIDRTDSRDYSDLEFFPLNSLLSIRMSFKCQVKHCESFTGYKDTKPAEKFSHGRFH